MQDARGYLGDVEPKVHGRKACAHLQRRAATICAVPEPQLTAAVCAPALDLSIVEKSTGVQSPRRNVHGEAARSQVYSRQVVSHLARVVAPKGEVAHAKLRRGVVTPALHVAGIEQSAGV